MHAFSHPTGTPPSRTRLGPVLVGLMLGVSLAALDMTIVATSVRTRLGGGEAEQNR